MKHMKLGSKIDIFKCHENVVSVVNELPSDLILEAGGIRYLLHKYPLLSKCGYLRELVVTQTDVGSPNDTVIPVGEIPGPNEAFVICAKFCYGIAITLNAFNVMAVRCTAQFLGMTEEVEKGNLAFMIDYFLNSCIFGSWKDCIVGLRSTKALLPWADDLKLVATCIDSIASMASVRETEVVWSFTYTKTSNRIASRPWQLVSSSDRSAPVDIGSSSASVDGKKIKIAPCDWWAEDICELDADLYRRVMRAIKCKGKIGGDAIWKALVVYAYKCLPSLFGDESRRDSDPVNGYVAGACTDTAEGGSRDRHRLEIVVSLLPCEKAPFSCAFMLKLLKAASLMSRPGPGEMANLKMDLARRIGMQLDDASLSDILIPGPCSNESLYDVDSIRSILEHFLARESVSTPTRVKAGFIAGDMNEARSSTPRGGGHRGTSASMSRVTKLVDAYLAEIAKDSKLSLTKFVGLAELVPDCARSLHDDLYKAIDVYLKEHKELTKAEKKRICRLLDCTKLSMEVCLHVAQNEHLPLRIIVQVLIVEQMRSTMVGGLLAEDASTRRRSQAILNEKISSPLAWKGEFDALLQIDANNNTPRDNNNHRVKVIVENASDCDDVRTLFRHAKADCRGRGIVASAIFSRIWLPLSKLLG